MKKKLFIIHIIQYLYFVLLQNGILLSFYITSHLIKV